MVELIAKSPAEGLLPVTRGDLVLGAGSADAITSVAPFNGQADKVSRALKAAIGAGLPSPNRCTGKAGARVVWVGLGEVLVLGPQVVPKGAAVMNSRTSALLSPRARAMS